jgi:hypothetical protein
MTSIRVFSNKTRASLLMGALIIGLMISHGDPVSAQNGIRVSPTPVQVQLPQAPVQPIQQEEVFASETPVPTSTDDPTVMLEVKPDLETADVRGMPEPEGERLDPIKTGAHYPVTGRYYKWIQFRYDKSLSGFGWVFEDLVDITGSNTIPDLDPYSTPTITPIGGNIEETRAAVTLTPGGVETVDAQARLISIPTLAVTGTIENVGPLPTFTMPAELAPRDAPAAVEDSGANTFEETLVRAATGQIPPIVPILVLAGLGLFGMIVSMWRR